MALLYHSSPSGLVAEKELILAPVNANWYLKFINNIVLQPTSKDRGETVGNDGSYKSHLDSSETK